MSETQFPLKQFIDNRMQTLFKEHLTDFEMYEELRRIVCQTGDVQVAIMYGTLGCEVGEFDDVIDVFENQFSDIQTNIYDEELDRVYISALVQSWQLEKAQAILNDKYNVYRKKGYSTVLLDTISDDVLKQFEMLQQEEQKDKEELLSKIERIEQLSYIQQQQIIPQLRLLNDNEFIGVARKLLQSIKVHALLKAYILEMLSTKTQEDDDVIINFYGVLRTIKLSALTAIDDTPFMKKLDQTIDYCMTDNNEKMIISQNAKLYLAFSYPFEQELFDDVEQFVLALLHKHRKNDNVNEWLERFEKLIEEMIV